MSNKFYRLGCDIGGTFTDFVLLNDQTGEIQKQDSLQPRVLGMSWNWGEKSDTPPMTSLPNSRSR
jgi:predicted NBD/HSP70 family sugar kinase